MKQRHNIETIEQLLSAYYEGATTIEDEQTLIEYFTSETNVPSHLAVDRDIFIALNDVKINGIDVPEGLEENISATIDSLDMRERMRQRRFNRRYIIGIAASLVIAIGIGIHFLANRPRHNEITDPQLAYNETVRALTLLSEKLNKANNGLIQTQTTIDDINQNIKTILK